MFRGHMSIQFDPSRDLEETPGDGTECSMFEFEIRYQAMAMLYKCLFRLFFLPEFCHKLNDFCLQKRPAPRLASLWYKTCLMNWDITVFCASWGALCPEVIIHAPLPISVSPPLRTLGPAPRLMASTFHAPPRARRSTGLWLAEYLDTVMCPFLTDIVTYLALVKYLKGCSQQWLVLYQYFETSVCKDEPCF